MLVITLMMMGISTFPGRIGADVCVDRRKPLRSSWFSSG